LSTRNCLQESTMTLLPVVHRTRSATRLGLALAAMLLLPALCLAQAVKGTLLGMVTDTTGAGVPGATVTVTEVQTGLGRSATTNASGNYVFSNLKDGVYRVEAEISGFRKTVHENVKVDVNTTVRVDLALQVGNLAEAVTVVQEAPPLQTDRADTGRIIESKQITEMPLSFFQGLLVTVPGATRPFRPHSQFFNSQDSLSTNVNGQTRLSNNVMLDGIDNNFGTATFGQVTSTLGPAEGATGPRLVRFGARFTF
jgi:carboxypeptidase family protein